MKKYSIVQTIMLSFLTHNDSYDALLGPANGYLKFDGKDIIFVTYNGKEVVSHTTNNAIALWLEQGKIEELK
jgi:hypothetical protein